VSPTREQLESARDRLLPDVAGPGLRVLFSGINPGLLSAWTGHHFARPGNRFWPALHRSGFTPRQLRPDEQEELLGLRLGVTNVVPRATARADELTREELLTGGEALRAKVVALEPGWLAVVGVTAYRTAFSEPRAVVGPQDGRDRVNAGVGAAEPEWAQRPLHAGRAGRGVRPASPGDNLTAAANLCGP
jgi:TDG/mug DNA glycosylase family protein